MAKNAMTETPKDTTLARPSFIPAGDRRGTENIGKDDVRLPRLAIAQQLSPQLVKSESAFIDGLQQGDMFNTLTGHVYGPGPLSIHVLRVDRPRGVEFIPREQGGGIKDANVPLTDPRMLWGPQGERPAATKFRDYIALVLPINKDNPLDSVIGISMKGSQDRIGKDLNTLIQQRNAPVFAGRYSLITVQEKNRLGQMYYNFRIHNAGWAMTEEEFFALSSLFEDLADKEVVIDQPVVDDIDSEI